jgi:hypothetical protein
MPGCGVMSSHGLLAGLQARLTATEIISWATAEGVGTGSVLAATGCPEAQTKLVN